MRKRKRKRRKIKLDLDDLSKTWRCKHCRKKFKCQIIGGQWTEIGPICTHCYLHTDIPLVKRKAGQKKKRKFKIVLALD